MFRRALTLVIFLCGCGNVELLDNNLPPIPTITSFIATPAALAAGGGTSLLSWTVVNEDNLSLSPPTADVTAFTSAKEMLSATTTYTLVARNSLGQTQSSVTVTVGP